MGAEADKSDNSDVEKWSCESPIDSLNILPAAAMAAAEGVGPRFTPVAPLLLVVVVVAVAVVVVEEAVEEVADWGSGWLLSLRIKLPTPEGVLSLKGRTRWGAVTKTSCVKTSEGLAALVFLGDI